MHDIEPHYHWRNKYVASEDERSPFYGRVYDEFKFTQKIYNYFIHPQWDSFGSATLYLKIIYVDYSEGLAIIELIGEWNDCLHNDVMHLKRNVIDELLAQHIYKYILIGENVLNFHASDDCYYEEWWEDVRDERGWICCLNLLDHVIDEMEQIQLQHFINFGENYNNINWRTQRPKILGKAVEAMIEGAVKRLIF